MTDPGDADASGAINVNGRSVPLGEIPAGERLLDTLRWRLGLKGTKEGCRSGECGACTVLVNGLTSLSCLRFTHELDGAQVSTIEQVVDSPRGRTVEQAFVAEGALQCGYCTPGFVVALVGFLEEHGGSVSTETLLAELGTNLCRCTGYAAIARAVERARTGGP